MMANSNNHHKIALIYALIGTITGILLAFNTIATSPRPPQLPDLCVPIVIAEAITCLLLLLHAIINRHNQ